MEPFSCSSKMANEIRSRHGEPVIVVYTTEIIITVLKVTVNDFLKGPTFWCSDAVAFRVEKTSNLGQVAIALDDIIEGGRLHEKGKVAFHHALCPFFVSRHEDGRLLTFHVAPHFLVRFDSGILSDLFKTRSDIMRTAMDVIPKIGNQTTLEFPISQGSCH